MGINAEIYVIDNCSSDNSIEYLQPRFPNINFIPSKINMGFAKANNAALKVCTGKYVLFLNPDTIISEDTLHKCLAFFETNQIAGAVGVRMIDGCGKFLPESKRSFPTPVISFFKLSGLSALFPKSKLLNRYALGNLDENVEHEVDVLSGAFMMIPNNILTKLGGFDENFFMYGEDVDLSYRVQRAGYQNFFLGNITILHFKGESTKRGSVNYVHLFYKAMSIFVKKHYPGNKAWLMNLFLNVAIFVRATVSLTISPFRYFFYFFFKKSVQNQNNFFLLGDDAAVELAEKILIQHHLNIKKIPQTEVSKAAASPGNTLVFCMGQLTYKAALHIIQEKTAHCSFKWHGNLSKSITGSNHKNLNGESFSDSE